MEKLFIANCTKQRHRFGYMLPENARQFMREIEPGQQIALEFDSRDTLCRVIEQHEPYGFYDVSKIKKGFCGIAYQLNKQISIEAIEAGLSQRDQDAIDRAIEAQKVGAVASDKIMADTAQQMGIRQTKPLQIEVIEEKQGVTDNEPKLNQTITVQRDGIEPSRGRRKNRS